MSLKKKLNYALLKPFDLVFIFLFFILSFVPLIIFSTKQKNHGNTVTYTAILSVNGTIKQTFPLKQNQKNYTYRYKNENGQLNILQIKGDRIKIKEANCGDSLCVKRGFIQKAGETIVCLPHRVLIEIKASDGKEDGSVIY